MKTNSAPNILIGAGRLAWNLIPALQAAGYPIHQLISRNEHRLKEYQQAFDIRHIGSRVEDMLPDVATVWLCVSDDALPGLAAQLKGKINGDTIVLHTSGSTHISVLTASGGKIGVFYPLQTFNRKKQADFRQIPILIEGEGNVGQQLMPLAWKLSDKVWMLSSEERMRLHVGAVFACNFTNYLYRVASDGLPKSLDFSVFAPLVRQTLENAIEFHPEQTQTGPAVRGDQITIDKHLELLSERPDQKELYLQLSRAINPEVEL